jgi:hypothetical protein
MASALQHRQAPQRPGIQTAGPGKYCPDGPEADHALTFNPDHPMGALQRYRP